MDMITSIPVTNSSVSGSRAFGRRSNRDAARECVFCGKAFYRSDILRRHYKTCPSRATQPLPKPLKKGKRRKACDSCAKSKLSCDFESPCESCLARNTQCTYQRVGDGASPSILGEFFDEQFDSSDSQCSPGVAFPTSTTHGLYHGIQHHSKTSIPFLLNYTNPETRSLSDTFGFSSGSQAIPPLHFQKISDDYKSNLFFTNNSLDDLFPGYLFPVDESDQRQLEYSSYTPTEVDDLPRDGSLQLSSLSRTNELVDHLTEISLSLPKDHLECAPNANLVKGVSLFSSSNIQRLVGTYFHQWHRHSPVVHSGTFNIETVSLPLLISVILTGALYSPSAADVDMARNMLDLAEECAFQDPIFLRLVSGTAVEPDFHSERCLEAVQAAFSMAQIQLREGSSRKRRHSRSILFDQVITAVRSISLTKTQNQFFREFPVPFTEFDWKAFALAEAKLRLACGIFSLAASFTILYNMPPRLYANELSFDMPCSVPTYLAQSAHSCYEAALAEPRPRVPPFDISLSIFLANEWDAEVSLKMTGITILHLFVLILAILQHLKAGRNLRTSCDRGTMQRVLEKWKAKWDICVSTMSEQEIEQAGFTRLAAIEFWHIANLFVSY